MYKTVFEKHTFAFPAKFLNSTIVTKVPRYNFGNKLITVSNIMLVYMTNINIMIFKIPYKYVQLTLIAVCTTSLWTFNVTYIQLYIQCTLISCHLSSQVHKIEISQSFYESGKQSERISFALDDILLGNLMSNSTIKSPLRVDCFGWGRPSPWILFTVFGLIISIMRSGILRPSIVGTWRVVPHKAWNKSQYYD